MKILQLSELFMNPKVLYEMNMKIQSGFMKFISEAYSGRRRGRRGFLEMKEEATTIGSFEPFLATTFIYGLTLMQSI